MNKNIFSISRDDVQYKTVPIFYGKVFIYQIIQQNIYLAKYVLKIVPRM